MVPSLVAPGQLWPNDAWQASAIGLTGGEKLQKNRGRQTYMLDSLLSFVQSYVPLTKMSALGLLVAIVVVVATVMLSVAKTAVVAVVGSGNTVLITGPMGAGKTSLFYRLLLGKEKETVTSQAPNISDYKSFRLVDSPGHDSQWPATMELLSNTRAIVFMVDATNPNMKAVGQKMFGILSSPVVKSHRVPILVAINKSEEKEKVEKTSATIQSDLVEELQSYAEMSDTIEDTDGNMIELTLTDTDSDSFAFSQSPCSVTFADVSVKSGNLGPITSFINSL